MTVCVSVMLSDIVSLRDRGTWQGYINLVYAAGASTGAPIGGLLAETIGWRWSFIAQGPLCLLALIAVAAVIRLPKQEDSHWKEKLAKIDFLGALILIIAIFGLLVGLDRGSNVSWSDPFAIAGLCTTPLFIIFVLVEKYVAKNPFAPGHIILDRSLVACYLCNFFSFSGWLAAIFFIPLYWQVTYGYGASQAGLLLVPSIICGVSGSLFGGIYMKRTAKYYWITVIAYSHLTIGLSIILLFAGAIMKNLPVMVVGSCICSFSNGIGVTTTLIGLSKSNCCLRPYHGLTDHSRKRLARRPSCRHSMQLPVPLSWLRLRYINVCNSIQPDTACESVVRTQWGQGCGPNC